MHLPRFHFFSLTFLLGFGAGSFVGVALALLAIAWAKESRTEPSAVAGASATPTPFLAIAQGALPTPDIRPRTRTQLEVRLGPGTAFAIVGTLSRSQPVELVGRDEAAEWAAIRFPPDSNARGWVPISDLQGVSNIERFAITAPTPLPRSVSAPPPSSIFSGSNDGSSDLTSGVIVSTPVRTPTPVVTVDPALPTATPRPSGPPDLAVTRISLLPNGLVSVTVGNRGAGELAGEPVFVLLRDLGVRSELLVSSQRGLAVGATVTLTSSLFRVDRETEVQAVVDPNGGTRDPDRSNNAMNATLSPPPTPTATPSRD